MTLINIFLVAIGGALGSVSRYLMGEAALKFAKNYSLSLQFPWPTFVVNIFGSLLMGIIYYFMICDLNNFDPKIKNLIMVGFLGGFTTFSSFSLDFFRLFSAGQFAQGLAYVFSSVLLSILALFFGFYLAKITFS